MNLDTSIFKSYDIRGVYPSEINEETAEKIMYGFVNLLNNKLNKQPDQLKVAVGRDNRQGSGPLAQKAIDILLSLSIEVIDLGLISTNDYYFAMGNYGYDGGLMVTASHNPPEYSGYKMTVFNPLESHGFEFISGKELLTEVLNLEKHQLPPAKNPGSLKKQDVFLDHLNHIFSFIDSKKIKPLKIVVDSGNGMNSLMVPRIFEKIPAELISLFGELDGSFPNRPPNPLAEGASDKIGKKILETSADLGIMFDVDGDRMFLVDEQGSLIRGDMTLLLLAKSMLKKNPGAGVVYNLICSHAVRDLVSKWGGRPIRSEVGYMNLARHMKEEDGIISGEVSGHFAFRDNYYSDNAFIALLLALQTISEDGRPLSVIIKDYSLYAKGDEINLKVEDIPAKLKKFRQYYQANIKDEIDGITVEFADWWFNVRPSNTEPLLRITVEAADDKALKQKQSEVLKLIKD